MTERYQGLNSAPIPRHEQPKSAAEARRLFEDESQSEYVGDFTRTNEDGSETTIYAYELLIDPMSKGERRGLAKFGLRAAQAGYQQAFGPVVLPNAAYRKYSDRFLTAVCFFLEKPSAKQPSMSSESDTSQHTPQRTIPADPTLSLVSPSHQK